MSRTHHLGHRRAGITAALVALAVVVGACSGGGSSNDAAQGKDGTTTTTAAKAVALPAGYAGYTSKSYGGDANWLCKPGLAHDVCSRDLDATSVAADGTTTVVKHTPADDPPIDCFYVYPTTSLDKGINSDFTPSENAEIATVYNQVARLGSQCRIFAPVYRQLTLSAIGGARPPAGAADPRAIAYGDVLDAFKQYIAHDSDGRGFVLIGHSQGAGLLTQLVASEIDRQPLLRKRLVAAYLLGASVQVPAGKAVGGTFANVPLCQKDGQTGCAVAYSSFRSTAPPPVGSLFGRGRDGNHDACVNPAALATGGPAQLHPYFAVDQPPGTLLGGPSATPFADKAKDPSITTPWVTYPDFITGQCVSQGDFTYLKLTVEANKADPRTDDIGGDLTPAWGMHLIDANVAMGDIERLVATQAKAYVG
jgi:Protein of unknown function (DUF3089)